MPEGARLSERCSCAGSARVQAAQLAIIRVWNFDFSRPRSPFHRAIRSQSNLSYYHLTIDRSMVSLLLKFDLRNFVAKCNQSPTSGHYEKKGNSLRELPFCGPAIRTAVRLLPRLGNVVTEGSEDHVVVGLGPNGRGASGHSAGTGPGVFFEVRVLDAELHPAL